MKAVVRKEQMELENDTKQAETFLRAIAHFKSNAYAMEFWQEKLAHRFPLYRWDGKRLVERNIQETQDNPTTTQ